ncbi:MAG: tetratricopeptide repeat protein [Candidatus Viridilinea halotolerans]|uniref:Tetratricopeptide repeat protein n=1 Tax=Candidatus Viridilinea halotolerans TaxID=2491704 RepID=A0A426U6X2_9CHLR|nr:MAG: tetratricopeptide repeat protein [Candidatus Viridilinea halotolerans]
MNTLSLLVLLAGLVAVAVGVGLFWWRRSKFQQAVPPPEPVPATLDLQTQEQDGAAVASLPDDAVTPPKRRGLRPQSVALAFLALAILGGLGFIFNQRLNARAAERLVVVVAPFNDGGDGQTGQNVATELVRLLDQQLDGDTTVALATVRPTNRTEALAVAANEKADLLIWGDVEAGGMLDSPSLRPHLVYTPVGAYGPNAWAGYQGRFVMPSTFSLVNAPINGQAVLVPLMVAVGDYINGRPDHAFVLLTRLSQDYPNLNQSLPQMLRGNILWARGFHSEAAQVYRLALSEPSDAPALLANNLAAILRDAGDPALLTALAETVRLLDGGDLGALRANLGALALAEGRAAAAASELEQARNLLPANAPLLLDLAAAYRESGKLVEAATVLQVAETQVRADEYVVPRTYRTLQAQRLQANLREEQGLLALAQLLQTQGPLVWELETAPAHPAATFRSIYSQLDSAVQASGQAVEQWRRIAASESAALPHTGILAGGQAERLELQAVRQRYYLALVMIEQERMSARSSPSLFDMLFGTGSNEMASMGMLEELLQRQPAEVSLHAALARAALVSGQFDVANAHYDKVINTAPQRPEGFFGQARVAEERGDLARANELYAVALERNAAFFPARRELARLAEERDDWAAAVAQRRALAELRPGPLSLIALAHDLRRTGPEAWPEAEQILIPLSLHHATAAIELARLYNDAGRPDVALSAYQDARRLDPASSVAAFELGETLARQGDYAAAEISFREALRLQPEHLEARLALADLYQGPLNDPNAAEREFQAALRQGVNDATWLERIGDAALANGNADQAQTTYAQAVQRHPERPILHYKLGLAQAARGQLEAAAQAHNRALELLGSAADPENLALRTSNLVSLADVRRLQGQLDEARNLYNSALQLDGNRVEAQIGLGLVAVGQSNWGVAHGHFASAVALPAGEVSAAAQFWLAESLLRRDDLVGAVRRYERALEMQATFPEAYLGIAQARYAQRDLAAALAAVNVGLTQRPTYAEAALFKGKLLQEQNQMAQALEAYDRSIAADGQIAESYYRRGVLHIQQGNYDNAIRDLGRAADLQANFPEAAYWLGRAHYAQGRLDPAWDAFQRAISYNATYVEAILYSGLVAEDMGRTVDAINAYRTVIELDAQSELAMRARLQLERLT